MTIGNLVYNHTFDFDAMFRVVWRYGDGDNDKTVVFDGTVSGDFPPDLMFPTITAIYTDTDGILVIEYYHLFDGEP